MTTEERKQQLRARLLEVALECRTLAGELQFLHLSDGKIQELERIINVAKARHDLAKKYLRKGGDDE